MLELAESKNQALLALNILSPNTNLLSTESGGQI